MKQTNNNGAGAQGAAVPQTENRTAQAAKGLTVKQRKQVEELTQQLSEDLELDEMQLFAMQAAGFALSEFTAKQKEYFLSLMF